MASFNRVILVGNLTRDPELRHLPSGTPVVNFRLAVNEVVRDRQTSQMREHVCFVDIVAWERQAETCNQYLSKGSPVLVEGRLVYEEWKNQQGETRNRLSVRASRVQFLSAPSQRRADGDNPSERPADDQIPSEAEPAIDADPDAYGQDTEDLPF